MLLQNNERLKERLDYVERRIEQVRSEGEVMSMDEFIHLLNTADQRRMTMLKEIGRVRARAIIQKRQEKPFSSVEELEQIELTWKQIQNILRDNHIL